MYRVKLFRVDDEIIVCNNRGYLEGTEVFMNDDSTPTEKSVYNKIMERKKQRQKS